MIKSSLLQSSKGLTSFTGNEPLTVNKSIQYGHVNYTWNTRYISLINDFFLGKPITAVTGNTLNPLSKFVEYANGTLPSTDLDYDMISQYNTYLATL
jgi:hypothetical protein